MKGNSADDSKWTGDMGECKVCGGEIPHGHTPTCVIHKYQQDLEKFTTAYTTMRDLVKDVQLVVDLDVDWEKFPETCLSLCHQDNVNLRQELSKVQASNQKLSDGLASAAKDLQELLLPMLPDYPRVAEIVEHYVKTYSQIAKENSCKIAPESKKSS